MTAFAAVGFYTGFCVLLMAILKMNCGRVRASERVNMGDGANERMLKAMRMQGNALEDITIVLLGLFALAALAAPLGLIHTIGIALVTGRVLHALGMGGVPGLGFGRVLGTVLSLLALLVTGGACVWLALT